MNGPLVELETTLLPQAGAVAEQMKFGDALSQAQQHLAGQADLPALVEFLAELVAVLAPLSGSAAEAARTHSKALLDHAREIGSIDDRDALKRIQHPLRDARGAVDALLSSLRAEWDDQVRRQFEPLVTVGAVLEGIDATKSLGQGLRRWAESVPKSGPGRWVPQRAEVEKLQQMREDLPARRESLASVGIDEQVHRFLFAVSRGDATLVDVTQDVLAWLADNDALARFSVASRVKASPPGSRAGRAPSG